MKKVTLIILAILLIVCGAFLMFRPLNAILMICWLFAASLIVNGVSNVVNYFIEKKRGIVSGWSLVLAILSVIFGIILISDAYLNFAVDLFLLYLIAAWFVIIGVIRIVIAFDLKKLRVSNWVLFLILGIMFIICGIISFIHPLNLAIVLAIMLSVNMFICGIDLFVLACSTK